MGISGYFFHNAQEFASLYQYDPILPEKCTIIVVDDHKDILALIKTSLENACYKVHGFTNPIEALTHIELGCKHCELLVTEVRMPKMTGFGLLRSVKELRLEIKVIVMTAFEVNLSELHTVLPSAPLDNVINKPIMTSKLLEVITPILAS